MTSTKKGQGAGGFLHSLLARARGELPVLAERPRSVFEAGSRRGDDAVHDQGGDKVADLADPPPASNRRVEEKVFSNPQSNMQGAEGQGETHSANSSGNNSGYHSGNNSGNDLGNDSARLRRDDLDISAASEALSQMTSGRDRMEPRPSDPAQQEVESTQADRPSYAEKKAVLNPVGVHNTKGAGVNNEYVKNDVLGAAHPPNPRRADEKPEKEKSSNSPPYSGGQSSKPGLSALEKRLARMEESLSDVTGLLQSPAADKNPGGAGATNPSSGRGAVGVNGPAQSTAMAHASQGSALKMPSVSKQKFAHPTGQGDLDVKQSPAAPRININIARVDIRSTRTGSSMPSQAPKSKPIAAAQVSLEHYLNEHAGKGGLGR